MVPGMGIKTEAKWDWEVIKALYMGGMSKGDILKIPRYTGLSYSYFSKKISEERWNDLRETARAEGLGEIAKPLITRMAEAESDHQDWLLRTIEEERKIFDKTKDNKGGKEQISRLEAINRIDTMARRQLGLDDRKPLNTDQRNLGILIAVNNNGGPQPKGQSINVTVIQQPEIPQLPHLTTQDPAILQRVREALQEAADEPDAAPVPGLRVLSPFKVKEVSLVDEKKEEPKEDLIDILKGAGYEAFEISRGTPEGRGE